MSSNSEFKQCQYIRPNGTPCGSPALKGRDLCYYHDAWAPDPDPGLVRPVKDSMPPLAHGVYAKPVAITYPAIEDAASIQCVIAQIIRAVLHGSLDRERANSVLYALQIASNNIKHLPAPAQAPSPQESKADTPAEAAPIPSSGSPVPTEDTPVLVDA